MPVASSTRQHLDAHLGQAEFALKVIVNFDCLKNPPAHESVHAALAPVGEARGWIRQNLEIEQPAVLPMKAAHYSARERHQIVQRRMARLVP